MQLDLFGDYKSNVALYPDFQEYFRAYKPRFLAAWGRHDPFFLPAGAEAFKRDIPNAVVRFFETGHFALETHVDEIAAAIRDLLAPSELDARDRGEVRRLDSPPEEFQPPSKRRAAREWADAAPMSGIKCLVGEISPGEVSLCDKFNGPATAGAKVYVGVSVMFGYYKEGEAK